MIYDWTDKERNFLKFRNRQIFVGRDKKAV